LVSPWFSVSCSTGILVVRSKSVSAAAIVMPLTGTTTGSGASISALIRASPAAAFARLP
jgi:hypothetical protein